MESVNYCGCIRIKELTYERHRSTGHKRSIAGFDSPTVASDITLVQDLFRSFWTAGSTVVGPVLWHFWSWERRGKRGCNSLCVYPGFRTWDWGTHCLTHSSTTLAAYWFAGRYRRHHHDITCGSDWSYFETEGARNVEWHYVWDGDRPVYRITERITFPFHGESTMISAIGTAAFIVATM